MSDSSKPKLVPAQPAGLWFAFRKSISRLQDWFAIQSSLVRLVVLVLALLIPGSALYSISLTQKQAILAEQIKAMVIEGETGEGGSALKDLPVVFGTGSVLGFLETHPIERIVVIYRALMWTVSERILLVESRGRQYAYYPSDMETKIFADKAVTAPWGSKLVFIPRSELSARNLELLERLDLRFSDARPLSEKRSWASAAERPVVCSADAGSAGFSVSSAQGAVQVAQVHRAGADSRLHR